MPVGEVFLGAFLQVLFDRLAPSKLSLFPCEDGIRSELKQWKRKFSMIKVVLNDAEEKQLKNEAVKMWLDDLQDLAYDVEDILEEYATQVVERELMTEQSTQSTNRIADYFTSWTPSALISQADMKSKTEEITRRLEDLCEEKNDLGLKEIAGGSSTIARKRPPSTCVPTEPAVIGRDADKAKILEMVLSDKQSGGRFHVIPIVGLGGVGKTTLAREVYNDKAVADFNPRAWACVSDDFDVLRISKAILESITASTCTPTNLNEVQVQLKNNIAGKKFLLVLDDVWSKDYDSWEVLKSPFLAGAPGSKIIVTTRRKDVASTMELKVCYNLELLPEDACWAIFEKHVSGSRVITAGKNMELLQQKVVKKCKGLPLAARTLAGLLRSKQTYDEWVDILDSEIWDLPEESNILPVLKLSYYHLPSHLKRCFSYCAIFPKDYEFKKEELVLLWMAEGLIQQSNHKKQLEDLGGEYFSELLSRSIFQQLSNDSLKFLMHDLVHDLAQWISRGTSFRCEDELSVMLIERHERIRHSSYTFIRYEVEKNFEVFHGLEKLRTFLRIWASKLIFRNSYVSRSVFPNLLPKLRKLRSLSLTNYSAIELPDSIGDLKHLRYLNLSKSQITNLPESTSSLFNLQSLLLSWCSHLKKLPLEMGDLINLRHLDIRGAILIREMPLGVKKLRCIRTLSNFVVGKGVGSSLKDLKELKFICGELYISRLENAIDCHEARDFILCNKKDLEVLVLEWSSSMPSRDEEAENIVLDILQPHTNLKELTINNFGGKQFSSWIGDPSFSNMVSLKLGECENCKTLPSIGLLGSLKNLSIKGIKMLEKIGCEVYGESCSESFQLLETLCFENLPEWEQWDPFEEKEHVERFSCLKELSISQCPKLSGRLPNRLPSLEKLVISDCQQLVVSFTSLPLLCRLEIERCKGVVCNSPIDSRTLNPLPSLETVVIDKFEELGISLSSLPMLRSLKIIRCSRGMDYPLPLLEIAVINKCEELGISFSSLPVLRSLQISSSSESLISEESNVPVFRRWTREGFQKLETLEIVGWEELTHLWGNEIFLEKPLQGSHSFTSLKELCMRELPNLVSFPDGFLSLPTKVEISDCNAITSLYGGLKHNNARVEHLKVDGCNSLSFIVRGQLPSSLKTLWMANCKKLVCIWEHTGTPSPSSSNALMDKEDVDNTTTSLLCKLEIYGCRSLTYLSSIYQLPPTLTELRIFGCPNLRTLLSGGSTLEGQYTLSNLNLIDIRDCSSLVLGREIVLSNNNSVVIIDQYEKIQALPSRMHTVKSVQHLRISECPSMALFPEEDIPTNITSLYVGEPKIYNSLAGWGFHKFTSLRSLSVSGCPNAVSFPEEEMGMKLPSSLTEMSISGFPKLKYLSPKGFQDLTSLEKLWINDCPNLTSLLDFPSSLLLLSIHCCQNLTSLRDLSSLFVELWISSCLNLASLPDLPSSLLQLWVSDCPLLKQRCKRDKGQDWPKITHIPCVLIDGKFIHDPEEEE
ncbi:putative disease resistance RPP13-like protein 1 [Pistacia vera]|uniref:putative disease resistance RPP13-like protein 1 n=1 Tax=Pistacia vera TaxID=55513 RepID=UPI001263470B|nr:putative disease resistance RPP13-like protein 1 [Pistacia vera]